MMPRRVVWAVLIVLAVVGCRDPVEIVFFFDEVCPSCEDYARAEEIAAQVVSLGRGSRRLKTEAHNAATMTGWSRLTEYIDQHDLPDISGSVPLLFVDQDYTVGYDDIDAEVSRLVEQGAK